MNAIILRLLAVAAATFAISTGASAETINNFCKYNIYAKAQSAGIGSQQIGYVEAIGIADKPGRLPENANRFTKLVAAETALKCLRDAARGAHNPQSCYYQRRGSASWLSGKVLTFTARGMVEKARNSICGRTRQPFVSGIGIYAKRIGGGNNCNMFNGRNRNNKYFTLSRTVRVNCAQRRQQGSSSSNGFATSCPKNISRVCGMTPSGQRTFSNDCLRRAANARFIHRGYCSP